MTLRKATEPVRLVTLAPAWNQEARAVNEEVRTELLERRPRRFSLPPRHTMQQWQEIVTPVDQANLARLREQAACQAVTSSSPRIPK